MGDAASRPRCQPTASTRYAVFAEWHRYRKDALTVRGGSSLIELPFPPASLSGHNTGHWRRKSTVVAEHREWAKKATLAFFADPPDFPGDSDIRVSVTFYPPDRRGDRVNYPNRMKPYWDGIADALGVNDRRFLPSFHYAEPTKPGCVVVAIRS